MAQSKQQPGWWRQTSAALAVLIALLLALPLARADTADPEQIPLQLDVRLNGYELELIAAFVQMPDGKMASTRGELAELGIAAPGEGDAEQLVILDTIPGVSYVYDEENQAIEIELPNSSRIAKDLGKKDSEIQEATSSNGIAVNYTAFASADYQIPNSEATVDGGSLTLDARAFSKFGALRQTGILGTTTFSDLTALRLDTTWSYSSQSRMETYRIGDIVSGGLNWTRPIRLGGAQAQRNFDLRPDLITMPLPNFQGTAEVPSSLKIFIGDVQAWSGDVQPGPFRLDSLPVYTTSGTARVVLTDSSGREVETEQQFYTSPDLLRHDLYDFSLEAGVVRRNFGIDSFGYDDQPVALASLRYGLTDSLTGEAHLEGSEKLVDVGVGGLFSAGRFGMLNAAAAGSLYEGDMGVLLHAGWEGRFGNLGISLSSSRTFGDFNDLAAVTAIPDKDHPHASQVPRELDQISLNYTFRDWQSGAGLSFVNQLDRGGKRSLILSGTYALTFRKDITAFVSGFADFGDQHEYGGFLGFSMPLGGEISASAGATASKQGWTASVEAAKPSNGSPGSYGWRVAHGEGDQRYTAANGSYRGTKASVEGQLMQQDDSLRGAVTATGAVVGAGGGLFLGNQIADSFAVVDAGAPGVAVEYENRFAGKTDGGGKLLLPDLRSYQKNKVSIDVAGLPLNADAPESETIVVPREMSGVVVDFGIKPEAQGALVTLKDASGKDIDPGVEVYLEGNDEPFFMGYDGQVYLTGLTRENTVTVKAGGNQCQAKFTFTPDEEAQTTIGPLTCVLDESDSALQS